MTPARVLVVVALLAGASGCASSETLVAHTRVVYVQPAARARPSELGVPLATGQIVVAEAPGAQSLLFGLGAERFFPFTHAGVVRVEADGRAYVYDFSAAYKPRFASTPADALDDGGMRRTPFFDYVGTALYAELYDPAPGVDPTRLAARIDAIASRKPKFDPHWDLSEHDRYFCTEFLADIVNAAGGTAPAPVAMTRNPSLLAVLRWFGVRGNDALPAALFIAPERRVAAFSSWGSEGAARAYLRAKAEIHRRFTIDQKLGNVLAIEGVLAPDVRVRPAIARFLDASAHLWDHAPPPVDDADLTYAIEALANTVLGPWSPPPAPGAS